MQLEKNFLSTPLVRGDDKKDAKGKKRVYDNIDDKKGVNDSHNENIVDYFYDECDERVEAGGGSVKTRYLKCRGFDCLDTVCFTRKNIPEDVKTMKKKNEKGKIIAHHSSDVMVLAWKDAKIISMISTFHDNSPYKRSQYACESITRLWGH
ncbi:hypothetical protein EVAR_35506_1 [Eumeta japonica]|uniref:PiggyBac transposable element-derived protein domain-containing protein n=1 Tax=Eumeta variegata TaxID=151549 RepID=A0A4C1X918_EUMVA|nr:hypothetical protein EVAR_35506_1 [Eumeta japonica]